MDSTLMGMSPAPQINKINNVCYDKIKMLSHEQLRVNG